MHLNSFRYFEIVRTLSEHRHFGRAAKALGVSQPSLTRSLKHLEDALGVRLFERQDGVAPTLFGQVVIERGRVLLNGYEDLLREIALMKGLAIGELTVAAGPFPAAISAQKAMGQLAEDHPGLQLRLLTTDWVRVVEDILQGRADIGLADISEAAHRPELATEIVRDSRLYFYCRHGHPLSRQSSLTLEEVMSFPWVGPTAPSRMRSAMPAGEMPCGFFDNVSNRLRPRVVVDTVSAARDIVLASNSLSVALPTLIQEELEKGLCVLLPIELPWMRLNYGFIWKKGRTHSPAGIELMRLVQMIEAETPLDR